MPANYTELEKRLWEAADELRANSKLKPSEYSVPVLGLVFLLYADYKFALVSQEIAAGSTRRRTVGIDGLPGTLGRFISLIHTQGIEPL